MEKRLVGMAKKLKVILIIAAAIAVLAAYDYYRSTQVVINIESITPEPAEADSSKPVTINVRLTDKKGNPVTGHNVYALSLSGGSWRSYREKSDSDGRLSFIYYPYNIQSYQQVRDVKIRLRDESNSVFIEIYPTREFTIKMKRPENNSDSSFTADDFF